MFCISVKACYKISKHVTLLVSYLLQKIGIDLCVVVHHGVVHHWVLHHSKHLLHLRLIVHHVVGGACWREGPRWLLGLGVGGSLGGEVLGERGGGSAGSFGGRK